MLYCISSKLSTVLKLSHQSTKTLILRVQYSYQKLTTDATITGIYYKGQYECECDPMILTNYIICISILIFCYMFGLIMTYSGRN